MSQEIKAFERSFVTGSVSLATKQYYIVKQHTDGTVILAAAGTDKIVGVVKNMPAVGAAALVQIGGTTKVIAGGTITVGAWVTSDSSGKAVATTTDKDVVLGKYLGSASAASGDIIEVQIGIFTLSA
jgi:hypothetical protein